VTWLHLFLAAVDIYLLVSLGPWIALQIIEWLLRGPRRSAEAASARLRRLQEGVNEQASVWPEQVRPGRYQEPDRLAQEGLAKVRAIIGEGSRLSPRSASYTATDLKLIEILCLRSWLPLLRALKACRGANTLSRMLGEGDQVLASLREQQRIVHRIPTRVRASLNETRAETRRLTAILEAEEEAGTLGLKEISQRLGMTASEIEQALDALSQAGQAEMPLVVQEVDQLLNMVRPTIEEIRNYLDRAVDQRRHAQSLITRVLSSIALAQERWEGLKLRGATEPLLERQLSQLQLDASRLPRVVQRGTLDAYQHAREEAAVLQPRVESLMDWLDVLDQVMVRSKEAVAGNVQALAQAQAACEELMHQDSWLDFDQSYTLIERSAQAYLEAERLRGLGTEQSYEASISIAETARQHLARAQEAIQALPEGAARIRGLLEEQSSQVLADLRSRIDRLRDGLQIYARHWEAGLADEVAQAMDKLGQAEADLERIPPDVRLQRRLRQSEVGTLVEILSHADACVEAAENLAAGLDNERQRIETLRDDLERALAEISSQTLPAIREQTRHMLAELQERFQTLERSFRSQVARLSDLGQVNYDEATSEWLPFMRRQLEDLLAEHENSLKHYRAALKEASRRIERAWTRLNKLDPHQSPGPEEDIDQLVLDSEAWHAEGEGGRDDPLTLREIVGRRATALEQRIETARLQIVEGRRELDDLDKEYRKCAQVTRNVRNRIRDVRNQSHWPRIAWSTDQAERAWEQAIRLERESRAAPTLATAVDQIQRGVSAAVRAEQLYARIERQMDTALRRLDEERRSMTADLGRARRQVDELRERGLSAEMAEAEELCARAEQILEMAEAATNFEDALWHLRDASRTLNPS